MPTLESPTVVSSTSDMMAAIPSDLFSGITDSPDTTVDEDLGQDTPVEAAPDDTIDVPDADAAPDEPVEAAPAEGADEDAAAKPVDDKAVPADDLPEGVRKGKDRKGKDGYFLEENRYQTFHGNHKIVQQGAELIGEPLTTDAIKLRNDAFLGQERLYNDLNSGDPAAQSNVLKYFIDEMKGAQANGEIGIDPSVPFAESIYTTLQKEAPAAYDRLRHVAARDLLTEMYEQGGTAGDLNLISSAQRFAVALSGVGPKPEGMTDEQYLGVVREATEAAGFPFHTVKEAQGLQPKGEDSTTRFTREIAELKAQLNGRTQTGTAEQYDTWSKESVKSVNTAIVDDAVKPALASVHENWKPFPDDYKRLVVDPLHREVMTIVKADPVLDRQVKDLQAQAKRAVSEQVRTQLAERIKQLFVHRANRAADASKAPILEFAAKWLKGQSDSTHERRTSAQARTTPKGPGAPVKASLTPPDLGFKDGIYDSATAQRQLRALLSA